MNIEYINNDLDMIDDIEVKNEVELEKLIIDYSLEFKTYEIKFKVGLN